MIFGKDEMEDLVEESRRDIHSSPLYNERYKERKASEND